MLTDTEQKLLSAMLYHGGFCTPALAGSLLEITDRHAREILANLTDRGYTRRALLVRAHDATSHYQITRKGGAKLGVPHPNAARSNPTDSQILRGIARLWFASQLVQTGEKLLSSPAEIASAFESRGLKLPGAFPTGDSYITGGEKLKIYAFPSADRGLDSTVKKSILSYAASLDKVQIGFVIEQRRATEMQEHLSAIAGYQVPFAHAQAPVFAQSEPAQLAELRRRFDSASAFEKVAIQRQIAALTSAPSTLAGASAAPEAQHEDSLARVILPIVVHDLF